MRNMKFYKYGDVHDMIKETEEYITNNDIGIISTMPDDYFEKIEYQTEGIKKNKFGYKNGFPYFLSSETDIKAMQEAKLQGRYQSMYPEEGATIGDVATATPEVIANVPKGVAIGIDNAFKLIDNVTGGAVTEIDNFLSENFPNTLGKKIEYEIPEGAAEETGKIIGQYVIPGAGVYKMARGALLLAEPLTVGLFSSKDEGNLANVIEDMFPNFTKSTELSKTIIEGLSVDQDDSEVMARAKNIVADAFPFVIAEKFYKILKGLKQNPEAIEELKSVGAAATPKEPPTPVEVVDIQGNPVNPTRDITPSEKPFYSNVEKAISNMTMKSGRGDQILATIQNTLGVKQSEIEDLGLDQFLAGKEKVTIEELNDFIADKSLTTRVTDTILEGSARQQKNDIDFITRDPNDAFTYNVPTVLRNAQSYEDAKLIAVNDEITYDELKQYADEAQTEITDSVIEQFLKNEYGIVQSTNIKPTKFGSYVEPGGENYKEMLITVPGSPQVFTKHHFTGEVPSNENLIAHARFDDRIVDNKKILFIEEIQSDLHQAGKKQGYKKPMTEEMEIAYERAIPLNKQEIAKLDNEMRKLTGERTPELIKKEQEILQEIQFLEKNIELMENSLRSGYTGGNIPNAPFKKNWYELTMKRLIKYAVDNGYDGIAFTSGDMQVSRYPGMENAEGLKGFYDNTLTKFTNKFAKKYNANLTKTNIGGKGDQYEVTFDTGLAKYNYENTRLREAKTIDDVYRIVNDNKYLTSEFKLYLRDELNELDPDSLLKNSSKEEINSYMNEWLINDYGLEIGVYNKKIVPFMIFPSEMKKEILQEGVPIAQLEDREQEQQTAVV